MESIKKYYRVERKEISFLKFIIEAYDNMAIIRTVDAAMGIIVLHIAPGCENEVEMILDDLKESIMMQAYPAPVTDRGPEGSQADQRI